MIKDESYYVVQGWMRNRLQLKGNDLIVYALVYSFSQDGESEFKGSLQYLTEFTGASERTIRRILDDLEVRGLIKRNDRNASTGLTNAYKCTPLDEIESRGGGADKMTAPVGQNDRPPSDKMTAPLPYIREDSIENIVGRKERKKEIDREKQTTSAHTCESENVPDFSKMTDEELIAWGEGRATDFTDPDAIASFYAWNEEMEKRATNATKWQGKIIKSVGGLERLKSHAEVMTELGVSARLRAELKEFLRYCYANRHLVTNEKLIDIILRLDEACDDDDGAKCEYIRRAIGGGFFDVKAGR
ncbi:MAG: helix-turn-helix domain-containing protein [Clostridia bacterium]|nr:helix-turn-helix domain-containing protein [Clostridia bacterium]